MTPTEPLKSQIQDPSQGLMEQGTPTRHSGLSRARPRLERAQLPSNWHYMLPEPKRYFGRRVVDLGKPNATGWAQGKCPFHDDPAAAFRVNVKWDHSQWHCFGGCGDGTMVDFHGHLYGLTFEEAVAELLQGAA